MSYMQMYLAIEGNEIDVSCLHVQDLRSTVYHFKVKDREAMMW
jgi:hypothetical protein